jgi:hypothetical protein
METHVVVVSEAGHLDDWTKDRQAKLSAMGIAGQDEVDAAFSGPSDPFRVVVNEDRRAIRGHVRERSGEASFVSNG